MVTYQGRAIDPYRLLSRFGKLEYGRCFSELMEEAEEGTSICLVVDGIPDAAEVVAHMRNETSGKVLKIKSLDVKKAIREHGIATSLVFLLLEFADNNSYGRIEVKPVAQGGMPQVKLEQFYRDFRFGEGVRLTLI